MSALPPFRFVEYLPLNYSYFIFAMFLGGFLQRNGR